MKGGIEVVIYVDIEFGNETKVDQQRYSTHSTTLPRSGTYSIHRPSSGYPFLLRSQVMADASKTPPLVSERSHANHVSEGLMLP